ncbi:MAG: hypothetical protein AVDCRST_MAG54-1147, partial [uncultured Actinomycetospora sp.]
GDVRRGGHRGRCRGADGSVPARGGGQARLPARTLALPGRAGHGGARRGLHGERRRPPHRGPGLGADEGLRARRQDAAARRGLRRDARLGPRAEPLGLDPRPLRGQQGRAEEGHQGAAEHRVGRARPVGRPPAAPVAAPAHRRPGRHRPLRVHHRARVHDRRLVGPLRQRQPLRPQDALRRARHRGLLLLAGPGLGRHVGRPRRRVHRGRRRPQTRHPRRARRHRGRRDEGRRDRPPAPRPAQRVLRGGDPRGRPRHLHAAGLARAGRRRRGRPARLVRRADQVPRPGPVPHLLARALPRHRGARAPVRPARALDLAQDPEHRALRVHVQPDRHGPHVLARGHAAPRHGRRLPRREGTRPRLAAEADGAVRGRRRADVARVRRARVSAAPPRRRAELRRHPEARARRDVPAALAPAAPRGPVVRRRDVPQPRHRHRPRGARRRHRRRGVPGAAPRHLRRRVAVL